MAILVRAIFGLGITSPKYVLDRIAKKVDITVVDAATDNWPKNAVVIVSGLNVLQRFIKHLRKNQVIVISDIASLLISIPNLVSLDYSNKVSYIFNYMEPDLLQILRAAKSSNTVEMLYNNVDQLGYVINTLKSSDDTINALIALQSNLGFSARGRINMALKEFFTNSYNIDKFVVALDKECTTSLVIEKNRFVALFVDRAEDYYNAYQSPKSTKDAAKEFKIDEYALSYLKKKCNALVAPSVRLAKQPKPKGLVNVRKATA